MKQYIVYAICILFLIGCSEQATTQKDDSDLSEDDNLPDIDMDYGELEFEDTDDDGVEDIFTLAFGKEEVSDGIFMEKKITYEDQGEGFMGVIDLEFSGEGELDITETIPKSFAESVDDIEFSVDPTEIIEDDPVVRWEVSMIEKEFNRIKIQAMTEATAAGLEAGAQALSRWENPAQPSRNAAESAAVGSVLSSMADFSYIRAMAKCNSYELGTEEIFPREACIINVLQDFPEKFTASDCSKNQFLRKSTYYACLAITKDSAAECIAMEDEFSEELNAKIEENCEEILFNSKANKCTTDECRFRAALFANHADGCKYASNDDDKNDCLANAYDNAVYCQDIESVSKRESCCKTLLYDKEEIEECTSDYEELEEIEEEQEDQQDFRDKSSHCPGVVPDDAEYVEQNYASNFAEGWQKDGKWYGLVKQWHDKEKTLKKAETCYDAGLKEGPLKSWHRTGGKYLFEEYKDDKLDGLQTNYWHDKSDAVYWEKNFKDGFQHGTYNEYYKDGSIHSEGNFNMGQFDGDQKSYGPDGELRIHNIYENGELVSQPVYKQG